MVTFTPSRFTGPVWKSVELAPGAAIQIAIKRPSLNDQLAALVDIDSLTSQSFKLRASICDWRDVQDIDGKPVPFTWQALSELCVSYPTAIWALIDAVRAVLDGPTETDQKNLPLPSAAGGTATTTAITTSITSSNTGDSSNASSDYATDSE